MRTFINYRFDLVNEGYEILFDGRKISYEEFKEIKRGMTKKTEG